MATVFCAQCGAPAQSGDRFCRQCGDTFLDTALEPVSSAVRLPVLAADEQPLVQFEVDYPPRLSRGLIFIKWLLAIPHMAVLYVYSAVVGIVTFIAWFAILFTGRYPPSMFEFAVGAMRWQSNLVAYLYLLRDEYPPFSPAAGRYPVELELAYPPSLSRWKIFLKWLLVIPNIFVFYFVIAGAMICTIIAWFAILFTGRYPPGMFRFVVGALRWAMRLNAYSSLLTDRYPPFTTAALPGAGAQRLLPA